MLAQDGYKSTYWAGVFCLIALTRHSMFLTPELFILYPYVQCTCARFRISNAIHTRPSSPTGKVMWTEAQTGGQALFPHG